MKRFSRIGWIAAALGVIAYLGASYGLVRTLAWSGMDARTASSYSLQAQMAVAPVGLLAMGAGGVAVQGLRLPDAVFVSLVLAFACIANGIAYGVLAESARWMWVRSRTAFWVLVAGLGLYVGVMMVGLVW